MAEYIEREALSHELVVEMVKCARMTEETKGTMAERVLNRVLEAPAADVVEVVRCKDCKFYQHGVIFTDTKFCCRLRNGEGKVVRYNFSDDDFCSYGERKNDEN